MCYELRRQFWQYSVLPQVADLLDATGRSNSVWAERRWRNHSSASVLVWTRVLRSSSHLHVQLLLRLRMTKKTPLRNQTEEESETTEDRSDRISSDEND